MPKTIIKPFDDLPFEERNKISYYTNQEKIRTIQQVISMLDDSIGQYQKRKLRDWLNNLDKWNSENWTLEEATLLGGGKDG